MYAILGRLPDALIENSAGFLSADDDPGNISPRLYLPVLGAAILLALIVFVAAIYLM